MRQKQGVFSLFLLSPSSRRAWIEIFHRGSKREAASKVALLAEGVDRNVMPRRGWAWAALVALLAEGVDRNDVCYFFKYFVIGRPPRGGRG